MCTTFSSYFVTKITTLKQAVAQTSHKLTIPPHPESAYTGSLFDTLSTVTPAEVLKLLSTIPPKTCSMDFIPTVLIKSCQTVFADLIATLANLSFSEGTFPSIFKTAVVTPRLIKAGSDPDSPENYRINYN